MDNPIDLERLSEVFTDHPWLAEALSNGAWWGNCDGTVEVVTPVEDPMVVRAGLVAFAEAVGCAPDDIAAWPDQARARSRSSWVGVRSQASAT